MPALSDAVVKIFKGDPFRGGKFRGSAFLIGERHLLTCEHVVRGIPIKEIYLLGDGAWIGGGLRGISRVRVLSVQDPLTGGGDEKRDRDVALLTLSKPADRQAFLVIDNQPLRHGDELVVLGCDDQAGSRSIQNITMSYTGYDGSFDLELTDKSTQEGVSGGPALRRGKVVGIARATEKSHGLIIPSSAFLDFVKGCVGELTAYVELATFTPDEMTALKRILEGTSIDNEACLNLYVSVAGDSRIAELRADTSLWSCVDLLSNKPHFAPATAPSMLFLLRCNTAFAEKLGVEKQQAIQQWCSSNADRLGIEMAAVTQAALDNNAPASPEQTVLTIVVEPLDLVSESDFLLKAWLWKDNDCQQCLAPDEPVGRAKLEKSVSEIIRIQRRMLGADGSRLQLELAVPYSLFSWNLNHLQCRVGPVVELMGALHPVSLRSWERMYHDEFDWFREHWPKRWVNAFNLSEHDGNRNLHEANSSEESAQALYDTLKNNPDTVWGFVAHFAVNSETDVNAIAGLFGAAFAAGIPLAFWTHGACTATKTLRSLISKLFVDKKRDLLPISLLELRKKEPDPWNDVAMLWDNPERLPPDIQYTLVRCQVLIFG